LPARAKYFPKFNFAKQKKFCKKNNFSKIAARKRNIFAIKRKRKKRGGLRVLRWLCHLGTRARRAFTIFFVEFF